MGTINKGIRCNINVGGNGLTIGKEYIACLYQSVKDNIRIRANAVAENVDGVVRCFFVFTPEQTATLKKGNCILEVYDTAKSRMKFDESFATVRDTSLSE
jgi:hypothetical protein